MYPKIAGAGESFPCRGVSTGAAPLKVLVLTLFFKRPCEDIKGSTKDSPPETRRGTTNPRRGVRGERGQRPRLLRECKTQGIKVCVRVGEADAHYEKATPSPPAYGGYEGKFMEYGVCFTAINDFPELANV
jgi:hypothetical protein